MATNNFLQSLKLATFISKAKTQTVTAISSYSTLGKRKQLFSNRSNRYITARNNSTGIVLILPHCLVSGFRLIIAMTVSLQSAKCELPYSALKFSKTQFPCFQAYLLTTGYYSTLLPCIMFHTLIYVLPSDTLIFGLNLGSRCLSLSANVRPTRVNITIIVMKNKTTNKIMIETLLNVIFGSSGAYLTFFRNLEMKKHSLNI